MENLSDKQLLEIYYSETEYSILLQDGTIIHTDDEPNEETLEETSYCICHSDFEVFFSLEEELKKRFLLHKNDEAMVKIFDEIGSAIKVENERILCTPLFNDDTFDKDDFSEIESLAEFDEPQAFLDRVNTLFNTNFIMNNPYSKDPMSYYIVDDKKGL